ncbi:hypothetical protein [Amorphus sp. 3PC139-8]|uniref:HORMA-1 domain-containing protein n=1 Tax=Amorphus sp. 3PC139-8 TaxID=2735676 RepID=UPI00345DAA81
MSSSYTITETQTFTVTHARHMASKVATDLKRMQRFYGQPSDIKIADFEEEMVALLKAGYLGTVTYGFRRDGEMINPTLIYTAHELAGVSVNDDDPGRIRPGADISGASFYSYMTYSSAWSQLSQADKEAFEVSLPIQRTSAPEPGINGYVVSDKTYSSGGRSLNRETVRSW